jgi:two-component system, NtrC family, sensor kinase
MSPAPDIMASNFQSRSLAFRLYLLIIPATVLAISLLDYLNTGVSTHLLDEQVQIESFTVATQLSQDLSLRPFLTKEALTGWLFSIMEGNDYITRIDVYELSGAVLSRIETTTSSSAQPITIDELAAIEEGRSKAGLEYEDQERYWRVIVPFTSQAFGRGCVTVVSTLKGSDRLRRIHARIALFLIPLTAIGLIVILHLFFTRGITRRIERLLQTMSHAKSGDLQHRATVDRRDELGVVAERFNDMMAEIERASAERDRLLEQQQDFNAQLQQRVGQATSELSVANDQLRQVNEDLLETQRRTTQLERAAMAGQMAATFAHEIGSPLSAISTHLDLMAEDPGVSEGVKKRARLIDEQVHRITGFVEELLSETRSAAQAGSAVQLNRLLDQLLLFLDQHIQKNRIRVETGFDPALPAVYANPQQIQQVFLNLLNNACDAMPNGGTIRIGTSFENPAEGDSCVVVTVSDNGIGIPPDRQQKIFEPFFTTKELGRGTGLGLSIAAKIIRQHDGTITLESAPNQGTTFTVRFRPLGNRREEMPASPRETLA